MQMPLKLYMKMTMKEKNLTMALLKLNSKLNVTSHSTMEIEVSTYCNFIVINYNLNTL